MRNLLLLLVGIYRTIGTTHLGGGCRFEPSCSEYAVQAIYAHKPLTAVRLISARIVRCRPGGPWGYDPVPSAESDSGNSARRILANGALLEET